MAAVFTPPLQPLTGNVSWGSSWCSMVVRGTCSGSSELDSQGCWQRPPDCPLRQKLGWWNTWQGLFLSRKSGQICGEFPWLLLLLRWRPDEDYHIISIDTALELHFTWLHPPEHSIPACFLEHFVQDIHGDDEEHRRQGVPLSNPPEVPDLGALGAIENDPWSRCRKQGGHPSSPVRPKSSGLQDLQQERPGQGVKRLRYVEL